MATKKLTLKEFISKNRQFESLIRATVRQMGGWEAAQESLEYIPKYGIASGIYGFIYYDETVPFAKRNRKQIIELLEYQADNLGENVIDMVKGFNYFRKEGISDDGLKTLYKFLGGGRITEKDNINVLNLLAWFAAEEVAMMYYDYKEYYND